MSVSARNAEPSSHATAAIPAPTAPQEIASADSASISPTLPAIRKTLSHRERMSVLYPFTDLPDDLSDLADDESDRLYSEADLRDILNYGR